MPPARDSFVGRSAELATLRAEVERVVAGEPRLLVISGEAGIGKTRMARRLLDDSPELTVLVSSGDESETDAPYGVVGQLGRGLAGVTPLEVGPANPVSQPAGVGAELLGVLGELQDAGPVAVFVDDAHWSDLPSLQALLFAVRRLRADRVLTILTVRPEEEHRVPPSAQRLVDAGHGSRLTVTGLTAPELGDLVRAAGHADWSGAQIKKLWEHTAGNPLWATALLDEVAPARLTVSTDLPLPAPAMLARSVRRRLDSCTPPARALVAAAAVAGGTSALGLLGALSEVAEPLAALDEAGRQGLLERDGTPPALLARFPHPLVKAAAYESLEAAPRAALHLRAAQLARDDVTRFRHEVAASTAPDDALARRVADHARQQRSRGAMVTAARAFGTAAALASERAVGDGLLLDAAETFLLAGEVGAAATLLVAHPELAAGPQLDYVRGWLAFCTGRVDEASRLLVRAWDTAGPLEAAIGAAAACRAAQVELHRGHGRACADWARCANEPSSPGPLRQLASALQALGAVIAGDTAAASAAVDWLPDSDELPPDALDAACSRGILRMYFDDLDPARRDLLAVLDIARSAGNFFMISTLLSNLGQVEYLAGHWDESLAYGERAASEAADLDHVWATACIHALASHPYSRRGRWHEAEQHVRTALRAAEMLGDAASRGYAHTAATVLAHSRRDYAAVLAAAEPLAADPTRDGFDEPGLFCWRELQIEALVRLDRLDEAADTLAPFEERAADRGRSSSMGAAARVRGLLEAARGDVPAAEASFDTAIAHAVAVGIPFEEALARLAVGGVLRRAGSRRAAAGHLRAAASVLDALDARPFAEWCDRELRGCGLTPARRSAVEQPALTPQEVSVAKLVAAGMSNRDVAADLLLSVKTVEYHLGNVYTKLGVRSRTQLAHRFSSAVQSA